MQDNKLLTLPLSDILQIATDLSSVWPCNRRFLITGGTGFFGRWIVESVFLLENELKSNNQFFIVSRRSKKELIKLIPALANDCFKIISKDLLVLEEKDLPDDIDYVIHGAVDLEAYKSDQACMKYGLITDRLISLLKQKKLERFLYLSSGAVYEEYGKSPYSEITMCRSDLEKISDKHYTNEKRASELIVMNSDIPYFILRCFAFVGPYLNDSMAIMSMIKSKINSQEIILNSPHVIRSYLYPVDLIIQLFRVLFLQSSSNIFNLGSPNQISLEQLAITISKLQGLNNPIKVIQSHKNNNLGTDQYVPNMSKLYSYLNINQPSIDLITAICKTIDFEKNRGV